MKRTQFLNKKNEVKDVNFAFDKIFKQLNFEVPNNQSGIQKEDLNLISKQIFVDKSFIELIITKALVARQAEKHIFEKTIELENKKYKLGIAHEMKDEKLDLEVAFGVMDEYMSTITHTFTFDFDKMSMDHNIEAERKRPSVLDGIRNAPYIMPDGMENPLMPRRGGYLTDDIRIGGYPLEGGPGSPLPGRDQWEYVSAPSQQREIRLTSDGTFTEGRTDPQYLSANLNGIRVNGSPEENRSFSTRVTSISLEP